MGALAVCLQLTLSFWLPVPTSHKTAFSETKLPSDHRKRGLEIKRIAKIWKGVPRNFIFTAKFACQVPIASISLTIKEIRMAHQFPQSDIIEDREE
jgi:hypothetical protein